MPDSKEIDWKPLKPRKRQDILNRTLADTENQKERKKYSLKAVLDSKLPVQIRNLAAKGYK